MKRLYGWKKNTYTRVAVAGVESGAGATHLSLCIANYLHSMRGQKVVYIEIAEKSQLFELVRGDSREIGECVAYKYKGVDYIVSCSVSRAREIILSQDYAVVVDLGNYTDDMRILAELCDCICITGSMSPWKERKYIDFVRVNLIKGLNTNRVLFLANNIRKEEKKKFKNMFGFQLQENPTIRNPFCIKEKELLLIEKIILKK